MRYFHGDTVIFGDIGRIHSEKATHSTWAMAAGETLSSKEQSAEVDERILHAIRDDLHETIVCKTDLKSLLPVLVKFGYLSESRRSIFERKTQSDANASFHRLLTRDKHRSLRRGFLLALKETATSVSSHNMLLSSLTKAAGVDMKSLEEEHMATVSTSAPEQMTHFMPPFKYHCPLNDHPSAIFSSAGGVLYSPVYGVMVYIPAGAILGEEQVEVSFRLVTEEAEVREFLSSPLLEGSVHCSGLFEFEAKVGYSPNIVKVDKFHTDVWIELPHCLSFIEGPLKDYSSAVVVSDSRGKVEVETQALFSEGYPYVNLPVRHFSRFCVQYGQRRFTWSAKRYLGRANASMSKLANDFRKLSLSSGCQSGGTSSSGNSPITQGRHIRQAMTRSSSVTSSSSSHGQSLYAEVKPATTSFPEQPMSQELVHQQSVDTDDDMMDVDTPIVQEHNGCHSSLDQELLHGASMSLYACVYQPVNRHTRTEWTADIVFAPLLPQALNALMHSNMAECECQTLSFELDPSLTRSLCLKSKLPSDLRGWTVELDRTKILLEEFNVLSALLSSRALTNVAASAPRQDASCSKVASFFPKSVARVCNSGAPLSLLYPIEVLRSRPLTHCFLSCMIGEDREEDQQCGSQHRKRHHCSPDRENKTTEASSAKREKVDTDIVWAQDQYLFVLLSILLPENTLSDVAKQLGLDELQLKHVQSIPPQSGVGEKMYDLFHRAVSRRSLVSFAQLQTCLSTLQSCQRLVSILDRYLIFRSSLDLLSGDLDEDTKGYQLLASFLQWTVTNQPNHSMPIAPDQDGRLIIAQDDQINVFLSLCKHFCSVWKMAARLLGLKDSTIDELVTRYDVVDDPCESAYQMLLKWAESCPTPSDVSYTRLHLVLSVIAHGTCAADAAFAFVQNRVTSLSNG